MSEPNEMIPDYEAEDDLDLIPQRRSSRGLTLADARSDRGGRRQRWKVTPEMLQEMDAFADEMNATFAPPKAAKAEKPLGFMGTLKEGAKGTLRSIGASLDTLQGDEAEVVAAARAQAEAPKDPSLEAFLADVAERQKFFEERKQATGEEPGWLESIGAVGGAALRNPKGAAMLVTEQLPNSAAALGAAATGAKAGALLGAAAGPAGSAVGGIVGGFAGLFGANTALETGAKALEAATDGNYTPEEQDRVLKEGLIKAGVVSGVDVGTLGLTRFIMGTTGRAVERATQKTLAARGVDVTNKEAVKAAAKNPEIVAAVKAAQEAAKAASDKLGRRIGRGAGALGLESVGEGAGEYLGEYAATGEADKVDAVVEAIAGLTQSAAEVAFTSTLNKNVLKKVFGSQQEAQATADQETQATGVEHTVKAHPQEPDKFVIVPKTRSPSGVEMELDPITGRLVPLPPEGTQLDEETRLRNAEAKPGFMQTAEDKLLLQGRNRRNAERYAANPIVTPGAPTPPANVPQIATATIVGRPVTELSDHALRYTAMRGGERAKAAAQAELDRRAREGVSPDIANRPESTSEAVSRIITTGREARDEQEQIAATVPPIPEPVATLNAQITALAEGRKPGVLITPGEPAPTTIPPGVKVADIPGQGTLLYRDDATLQAALNGQMGVALGYGIDQKPADATEVVTARAPDGTVIQDVATDGSATVQQAAEAVAGPEGTVETRPVEDALGERTGAVPAQTNEPTIEHDGDTWRIVATGATRDGKVFTHLASTTRGKQTKNGINPLQINDWIDTDKIAATRKKRQFKVDGKISRYHDPISESLRARVEDALNNEPTSYEISDDGFIHLPKEDAKDNQRGSLKVEDDGRVQMLGDSGFGWGSTMTRTSIEKTLKDWLKYVEARKAASKAKPADKEPWQMTRAEFIEAVRNGRDFPQLGTNPTPLKTLRGAKDFETLDRQAADYHAAQVTMAVAEGRDVPANVRAEGETGPAREGEAESPAGTKSETSGKAAESPQTIRPLVDSLIKRRSAARQLGHEKTFDKVLVAAKALLAGEEVLPARFTSAAAILKGDPATVEILNALKVKAEEAKTSVSQARPTDKVSKSGQTPPATPSQSEAEKPAKPTRRNLRERLEAHFVPGNIIRSNYSKEHDRVVAFDWNNGVWSVTVEKVQKDKDGNWVAKEGARTHATEPDERDVIVERAKAPETPPLPPLPPLPGSTTKTVTPEKAPEKKDDARLAKQARDKASRSLHVIASTDGNLMMSAGTSDLAGFIAAAEPVLVAQIRKLADEYAGPEKDAVLELVKDGKPVLPKNFFETAYKTAKKAWDEQQKIAARDPQLYQETLDWGMGARNIEKGSDKATQYKDGFDHALKGKSRSTLPQDGTHLNGYDDARAWIKTEDGKAWFEGKPRQAKEKSTGEALKRTQDRMRKGLDNLSTADMKKAWQQILKSTVRAELFPNQLHAEATPGAKGWLDEFRGKVATFAEFYTREMVGTGPSSSRWGVKAENVFNGSYTSDYRGRGKDIDWKSVDASAHSAEIAAWREKAKAAVVALYEHGNKQSAPTPEQRALQQEVIDDESRWQDLGKLWAHGETYKHVYDINAYFHKKEEKQKDIARLELSKQIAQEYQQYLADLAQRFDGLKSLSDIRKVIEEEFGTPGAYTTKGKTDVSLYTENWSGIVNLLPKEQDQYYKYSRWAAYEATENKEREEKARKDTLMRPRLDRIVRNMPDDRKGRSISAAEFKKIFNFADVTIGQYVTAQEAEDHLNYAHDALQSLAHMLGAKPAQLSFGGKLHFSIGALGHGKYAAHFNPAHPLESGGTVPVINVTKTRGDGSVLHEYFHAIDFLTTDPALKKAIQDVKKLLKGTPLGPEYATRNAEGFLSGSQSLTNARGMSRRDMLEYAFDRWYKPGGNRSTRTTSFYSEALDLDKGSDNPYWSNEYEPWARASESWGFDRLKNSGQRDDYAVSDWVSDGKVTRKTHRGAPYPQGEERVRLNALMQQFVDAVEWTGDGPKLKADHAWQKELPFDALMKPYADEVARILKDVPAFEREMKERKEKAAAEAQARKEQEEREKLFGKQEEQPETAPEPEPAPPTGPNEPEPAPEPTPPTASSEPEGDAPLSEDELSAIFDDVAASMREETQEQPDAPEPGEKMDTLADTWTKEDVFHILNLVMQGRMVLWSGDKFAVDAGFPTIHDFHGKAHVTHMGYGLMKAMAKDGSYTVTFDAGSSMSHTPGGKAYTTVSVDSGAYPYPKEEVIAKLHGLLKGVNEKDSPAAEAAAKHGEAADQKKAGPKATPKPEKPLADLTAEQEKTAGELAAEFAKHGVKGLDKTLSGLVKLFGGGPGKLQSFPGGFDEETYAQAKALFREAAEEFRAAGMSFKEFVRVFFRTLIAQFGDGVKPYAIRFAQEYQKDYEQVEKINTPSGKPEREPVEATRSPSAKLSDWIFDRIKAKQATSWQELFAQADREFGGTQANGVYSPKDAYDAVELAINRHILEGGFDLAREGAIFAQVAMGNLENVLDLIPTQTKRTKEMDEFQQFSTPPHFAYLANWVANLNRGDVYLEPSAGVGGLAVFGKAAGVRTVIVNELSERRASLLHNLPFDRYFAENAEQLHNILPDDVKPTVVVMNPPFSATAGRMEGRRDTMNGAKHIEQALKRLAEGGRLVAIVGEGMAADRPAFRDWWAKIQKEYNVRANIGVSGESYAKYGTTFDNQLLVIDKNGPTTGEVITGKVDHPADALQLLEGVRNDRPTAAAVDENPVLGGGTDGTGKTQDSGAGETAGTPAGTGAAGPAPVGGGGQQGGAGTSPDGTGVADGTRPDKPGAGGRGTGRSGRGGKDGNRDKPGGRTDAAGDRTGDTGTGKPSADTGLQLEARANAEEGEITNSVFESYTPKKVRIEGAVPHNTPLVESAAMAAVVPPDPTYVPNLPRDIITSGALSDAQLEAIVYAGQAHNQMLRDGKTRRGFFVGDGTGLGKGREISGVILDNMRQGRKKAVWISKSRPLLKDARRDFGNLGGDTDLIFPQSKTGPGDKITAKEGILFSAYPTLRSRSRAAQAAKKAAGGQVSADKDGISYERIRQIVDWVGKDFDGVIVFDEAHEMGNAVATRGRRGRTDPSDQALACLELQAALPNARIMYVSATGATEVSNLGYAPRLGLWGEGTPFQNVTAFINAMSSSVSAMELVAQNLKQMGLYTARSLSFDGVTYEQLTHELSSYQRDTYDLLAGAWQTVLNNMDAALELTGATGGGRESGRIKSAALSAFWGSHQRFFNQIITAAQMPSILDQIERDLQDGLAVVLQLTNTDEAVQNRAIAKAAKTETGEGGQEIEELDLTPREQLITMVEKAFPVLQYETVTDAEGNPSLRPVLDSSGNQVINKEALAMRNQLVANIRQIDIPDSPLQMLMNHFGPDKVAEITGRTQRVIQGENGKFKLEKRSQTSVDADADAFKDGKKDILVFSQAGGTGFSFHSDRTYKNQKKRAHYIMQAGWSADRAVQGFGRSHRTNQANAPVYRLVKTNIPAHSRFISSIARRLEQLGALTAGQRDTAGGSLFSAADNLESQYSENAVRQFFETLVRRGYPDMPADLLQQMGLTGVIDPNTGGLNDSRIPEVTQFLNRLMSLRLDTQTVVFDAFMREMETQIEMAKRLGTFDDGLATIKHVGADVVEEKEVYRDPSTNANVRYIEIKYRTPNPFYEFDDAQAMVAAAKKGGAWFKNKQSGRVAAIWATNQTATLKDGRIVPVYGVFRTGGRSAEDASKIKVENFDKLTEAEARALWEAENSKRPQEREHALHMVVGGILPLWDRFNQGHVQVARIGVDDGRRFLGRTIAQKDLADTLNRLNVESSTAKTSGADLIRAVASGQEVELSNRWKLVKSRVSNDSRVEIDLNGKFIGMGVERQLTDAGVIIERINWQNRFFIPSDPERGGKVLDALLKSLGANAVTIRDPDAAQTPGAEGDTPAFSRSEPARTRPSLGRAQIRSITSAIAAKWKNAPEIVIVDDMDDPAVPPGAREENARQLAGGASGTPRAFIAGNRVYIVASEIGSTKDLIEALFHESLGHFGLRGLYGADLNRILKQIAALRRGDVEAMAKRYGLDMENEAQRLKAAEEVLTHLAQTRPESGFVQRAIAAIRKWLREHVPGFANMKLSDGEIIENYLVPARRFVEQGGASAPGELAGAFSRKGFHNTERKTEGDANHELSQLAKNMRIARTEKEAKEKSAAFINRRLENLETGFVASVSERSFWKMLHHSAHRYSVAKEAHYLAMANIDHLFRLATRELDPRKGFKPGDEHLKALHHFDAPMLYEGEVLLVEMLVKEFMTPDKTGHRIYTLQAVQIATPASIKGPTRLGFPSSEAHLPAGVGDRFAQMAALVKGEVKPDDIGFSRQAQTGSAAFKAWFGKSKVVDKDGKPLRVYHGTTADFAQFSEEFFGEGDGHDDWGEGFYFTDRADAAAGYAEGEGGNVMPVFLAINKPATNKVMMSARVQNALDDDMGFTSAREVLEELGYDGIAFKHKDGATEYVAFYPEQIKSAIGNNGDFDLSNRDILFSRTAAPAANVANPANGLTPFRDRMERIADTLIYNFQDRFKPLRDIQKRLQPATEAQDAVLAEELYSGTVRARTDDFHADMRDPLIEAIHKGKLAWEEVEEYLHARHAPSRNAAMREINPTEEELKDRIARLEKERDALAQNPDVKSYIKERRELRVAEADIEDGIADESLNRAIRREMEILSNLQAVKDYKAALGKLRALRSIKPFQGDNTALSGMSNEEAEKVIKNARATGKIGALERVSRLVDGITTRTQQIIVEGGLESPETIAAWNEKYQHYVPLHRDEVNERGLPPIGQGFNIRGRESKRATGSTKEVTNILAHIVAQHEAAIIRSEKAKVDRALFELARANPDPSLWTIDTAPTLRTVDPVSGAVVNRVDPLYKQRANVLTFKMGGQEHTISFNEGNQQGMRLAASMKNLSTQQLGEVTQTVGRMTRFLATMSTTANPVFIARNFMRDLQTAYVNLSDTELAERKMDVYRDLPNAIRGMWNMQRGDMSSKWAKYAREFRDAGGQTGWMDHYRDIGERADALKRQLRAMEPGKWNLTRQTAKAWWQIITDANNSVENGMRLSAFIHAREAGLSDAKAASLAKNLTVNFNTKGARGVEFNMWYMFANASIQGSARLIKALNNKQVRTIVSWVILSGFLLDMLARSMAGDDDDDGENDYDQLPEHVKSMNFVFMVDNQPVTVPMPYGYNFFSAVGRKMSEILFRENYTPARGAVDLAGVFFDAFSPVGQAGSALQLAAPTVVDPFVQWAENRNFAGNPLRREQHPFGVPKPEYQMGFRSTSAPAKWLAETLNDLSGGNEVRPGALNINPVFFDFAVTSVAGGAGRTYTQVVSGPMKVWQDEEIEAREVPFANIFLSAKPEYQVERKYYEGLRSVELAQEELKNYRGDAGMIARLREEHGNELKLATLAKYTQSVLSYIRKQEARLDRSDAPDKRQRRRELAEKRRAIMSRFNKKYQEAVLNA